MGDAFKSDDIPFMALDAADFRTADWTFVKKVTASTTTSLLQEEYGHYVAACAGIEMRSLPLDWNVCFAVDQKGDFVCTGSESHLSAKLENGVVWAVGSQTYFPKGKPKDVKIPLVKLPPVKPAAQRNGLNASGSGVRQDQPVDQTGWTFFRQPTVATRDCDSGYYCVARADGAVFDLPTFGW